MKVSTQGAPPKTEANAREGNADNDVLRVEGLSKSFGPVSVLNDISLCVRKSDVVSIIGPSGSGKSTLLRCIAQLEKPTRGIVALNGTTISDTSRRQSRLAGAVRAQVGMVFQNFNLWPHLTVIGNIIEAPPRVRGISRAQAIDTAEALLKQVGLLEKRNEYPANLSGGQQQRVAIARALAMAPQVMLFDEATSALDPELTHEVLEVIRQLALDGMTMLLVTHEMQFARRLSSRVVFMDAGRIVEDQAPEAFFTSPQTERAQRFLANFQFP